MTSELENLHILTPFIDLTIGKAWTNPEKAFGKINLCYITSYYCF